MFTGQQGITQDAKFISNTLDYNGSDSVREWLESMFYYVLGLPERVSSSNGSDTGQAVELRNGWTELDGTARSIESRWYGSERESLKRVIRIMKINSIINNITVTDIDVKFSRNKLNNLLVKSQAALNLVHTNLLNPTDILSIVDVSTSPNEMAQRGLDWINSQEGLRWREVVDGKDYKEDIIDNNEEEEVVVDK